MPLQQLEGVGPTDPERTFYEYAGHWLAWYHGWPAVVLALVGAALLLWRVVRDEARAADGVVLAFALIPLALIIAKPSIYPDQPWAARRMVPFALRGHCCSRPRRRLGVERLAAAGADPARRPRRGPARALPARGARVGRVAGFQEYAGLHRPIDAVCSAVPKDAAVVVINESNLTIVLPGRSRAGAACPPPVRRPAWR